jgi:hypothetical protein
MHIYKFRLLSEEHEDFIRDIEILGKQTFKDFHDIISECAAIDKNELASFYICNQAWRKQKEITLIDMMAGDEMLNDDDDDREEKQIIPTFLMDESKIRSFIEDPHQRMIFEYDFTNQKLLLIELIGIWKKEAIDREYPLCSMSKGSLKAVTPPKTIEEELEEDSEMTDDLVQDFTEMLDDTYEFKGDGDNLSV